MNLNLYSSQHEENIYIRKQAQAWRRSNLITEEQLSAIHDQTDHQLRETNKFFQLLFFIFTWLGAAAITGLFTWFLDFRDTNTMALLWILFGAAFYAGAEYLAGRHNFYRYGIEEALVVMAIILCCAGCSMLLSKCNLTYRQMMVIVPVLIAVSACWVYIRFGFLYAACVSIIAMSVIPFQFNFPPATERLILLSLLSVILVLTLLADKPDIEDFRKDNYTKMQACLLIAIYLTVNLEISGVIGLVTGKMHIAHFKPKLFPSLFYWSSYVLTFIVPAAAIYWGIKSRKRLILNAGIIMACVTLATNKSYLGWTRYAWDPAILGIVLAGLFLFITRWLNSGPDQQKSGFTARNILKPEEGGINLAEVTAALMPGAINAQQQQTQEKYFNGGASGGGGVDGKY